MAISSGELAGRAEQAGNKVAVPLDTDLRLGELVRRTLKQAKRDQAGVYAGNMAYRVLFALFPSLVSVFWLLKLFGASRFVNNLIDLTATALPKAASGAIKEQLTAVSGAQSNGTLTFGAIVALIVAVIAISAAFRAVMDAMNAVYDVEEHRSYLHRQLLSLSLSVAVSVLLVGALILVLLGSAIANRLASTGSGGGALRWIWLVGTWPVIATGVLAAFGLIYYYAPDVKQKFRWISGGSVVAAIIWLLFATLFSLYVNNFVATGQTYGALAGVAILMVYLYISSFILVLGAEINQVIEARAPGGKDGGERTPT